MAEEEDECTVTVVSEKFDADDWGIGQDEGGFKAMTSVSKTERQDKAEAKNSKGCIVGLAFYNKSTEVSIEGIGTPSFDEDGEDPDQRMAAGDVIELESVPSATGQNYIVDEVSIEFSNEDWQKGTVKATAYENIDAGSAGKAEE
tara:strand:- start:1712 stop:2146 length:435 start_codon:yes stop_codon:yes gene_type:complete